ncbi:MAG: NADH-quinone oxidoreductase subunit L, partial [Bacteroidota bacterium]
PIVGFFVAGLTAFYMFRLVILTFYGEHKDMNRFGLIHESPKIMTVPLVILAVLSFFIFYSFNPLDGGEGWISRSLERPETVVPVSVAAASNEVFEEAHHHAHMPAMILSMLVAGIGIAVAFATYYWKKISVDKIAVSLSPVHRFLLNKWGFDDLYMSVVVNGTLAMTTMWKWFDDNIIDGVVNGAGSITKVTSFISGKFDNVVIDGLVNLTAYLSGFSGLVLRKFQTGRVQTYIVFAVFGVMIFYFAFRLF